MSLTTALLPITALLKAELLRTLRLKRTFFLLLLLVGVVFVVGAFQANNMAPRQATPQDMARIAQFIFIFTTMVHLIAAALVIPGMAAGALCTEREAGTYDQLHLTLIRPSALVLGKLLNVLGFYALLVVATLPVLGTLFFHIGVDLVQFGRAFGILASTSLSLCAGGLWLSAVLRDTRRASTASYVLMLLIFGMGFMICFAVLDGIFGANEAIRVLRPFSVVVVPFVALSQSWDGTIAPIHYFYGIGYHIALALVFFAFAVFSLRRVEARHVRSGKTRRQARRLPMMEVPDTANPVFCLERQMARAATRFGRSRLLFTIFTSTYLLVCIALGVFDADALLGVLMITVLVFTVAFSIRIAASLTRDHGADTLTLLRGSPLGPVPVFRGKILAELHALRPYAIAAMICLLLALLCSSPRIFLTDFLHVMVACVEFAIFFLYTGVISIFAAAACRRVGTAIVSAALANFGMQVILPVLLALISMADGGRGFVVTPCPALFAMLAASGELRDSEVLGMLITNLVITLVALPILYSFAQGIYVIAFGSTTIPPSEDKAP